MSPCNNLTMLYIVATPIGNLEDISYRAINILNSVDYILAEDTRHTKKLLQNYNINTVAIAFHEHNERLKVAQIINDLKKNISYALVSDSGTPLISDPGYILVSEAKKQNITIIPIPGASALITALSASGIECNNFTFIGFLPSKIKQRQDLLKQLVNKTETTICYESPKRIIKTLIDIQDIFGEDKIICLAKELTKKFENIQTKKIKAIILWLQQDDKLQQGEFVVIISGCKKQQNSELYKQLDNILPILLTELNITKSAKIAAKITGLNKRLCYCYILENFKI